MTRLIFFDTETTGNTENDFLCQIAYKISGPVPSGASESFTSLYKPKVRIPPEASAVHHITNKIVEDKIPLGESEDLQKIKNLLEDPDSILVAHNAVFDILMIKKEGINPGRFICTLRVARHMDAAGKIERYNLQYLRYLLEIEIEAAAHDALGDVLVLEKLFDRLKKKVMEEGELTEREAIEKMIEISSHPSILQTFKFGKYNGKRIEEILKTDRGYLEWLLREKESGDQIDEDWIYTLKHYLRV